MRSLTALCGICLVLAAVLARHPATVHAQTDSPAREQRERELALAQHLRRHLRDPGDGLALAADRRDLLRVRAGTAGVPLPSPTPGAAMTDAALFDTLAVVGDLWHARLNDRIPFGLMPRDRLSVLTRAQDALGQLQARANRDNRDSFLPDMLAEVQALGRFAAGQGEVSDEGIDLALRIADQAATGRPILGPGPYPMTPADPGAPPNAMPPGAMPPPPPAPPLAGPSPYELPPGYAEYAPSSQSAATSMGCQSLRQSASASESVGDMLRAAECWSRQPTWPGWALQVLEALDWAALYARFDRDCNGLDTVVDSIRDLGGRTAIAGLTGDMTSLARRVELDRRWMRSRNVCR